MASGHHGDEGDGGPPSERPSFLSEMEDELIAGLDALGPRDRMLLAALVAKVREVEAERGEAAACALVEAVVATIRNRGNPGF